MSDVQSQINILTQLAEVVHNSTEGGYTSAGGEFSIDGESTASKFFYFLDGDRISAKRNDPNLVSLFGVLKLQKLMKSHTGGEWTSFTLMLDTDGKATTKFNYPDNGAN